MATRFVCRSMVAFVLAGGLSLGSLVRASAAGSDMPAANVVTANGTARVYRSPDFLDVIVGVTDNQPSASEAQQSATKRMESVMAALKALKLPGAEFQSGSIDLSPRYNDYQRQGGEPKIVGYVATNTLRVRTTDLSTAATIIDTALKAGANRVDSVAAGLKEYLAAREEALTLAAQAAHRKASVLARALDSRLGKLIRVSESESPSPIYANRMVQSSNVGFDDSPSGSPDGAFEPGKVEVIVTVTVVCEIMPK